MSKITPMGASRYLANRFPDIKEEIKNLSIHNNFAGVLQAIINYLRQLLAEDKMKTVSRLVKFVGWVYSRGNNYIKEITENLFVRSLEGIHKRCTAEQWSDFYKNLPKGFKVVYVQQQEEFPSIKLI